MQPHHVWCDVPITGSSKHQTPEHTCMCGALKHPRPLPAPLPSSEPMFSMWVLLCYEINHLVQRSHKYHRPQNVQLVCRFKMCCREAAISPQQCDESLAGLALLSLWFCLVGEMLSPITFAGLPLDGVGNTDFSCTLPEPISVPCTNCGL